MQEKRKKRIIIKEKIIIVEKKKTVSDVKGMKEKEEFKNEKECSC
jgi:hypothetical protein